MSDTTCPSCHATLPSGAVFCTNCGHRTDQGTPPAPGGDDATRVESPGLHDSTQVYGGAPAPSGGDAPPAAPPAWQPADPAADPAAGGGWGAPAAPAAPSEPSWGAQPGPSGPAWGAAPASPPEAQAPPGNWGGQPAEQPWGAPGAAPGGSPAPAWGAGAPGAPAPAWGTTAPAAAKSTPIAAILAVVGGAVGLVSLFLTWFALKGGDSITAWAMTGANDVLKSKDPYLLLAAAIVAIVAGVVMFMGKGRPAVQVLALVAGLAVVGVAIRDWMSVADLVNDTGGQIDGGIGYYLAIAGGAVAAVGGALGLVKR